MFVRPVADILAKRLREPARFIQVVYGPRQAGKTTLVRQVIESLNFPAHYASADEPTLKDRTWLAQQWEIGRLRARGAGASEAILALDEIQKIPGWPETVKSLWDADQRKLKVILLGSSPLLMHRGLTESLAGRFEVIYCPHWSYPEMRSAFGWDVERYIFFGGYPGAAHLVEDWERWRGYIIDSLVETTVSRDILLMTRVDKPALLRRLFQLGCSYSGQILSFQKMMGQLQDAGNTTTLAHYLELLTGAGMLAGLPKFSLATVRARASSPKLQVLNTALMTAPSAHTLATAREDRGFWGRLIETAAGAHLVNASAGRNLEVSYWRERGKEVDFVLRSGKTITAIEIKSGRARDALSGVAAFSESFKPKRMLLVGEQGIPLSEFLETPPADWVG